MPKPTKGPRLGGGPAHERLLLGNLASQLFEHRSITTTEAKAKRVRPLAERLVTFAKRGDLHARRRVMRTIGNKTVVHELFTEIAPLVQDRPGGYTRIVKTGYRKGDNAPMAVIELVLEPVVPKRGAPAAASGRSGRGATAPTAGRDEVPVTEGPDSDSDVPATEDPRPEALQEARDEDEGIVEGTAEAPATGDAPPKDPGAAAPPAS